MRMQIQQKIIYLIAILLLSPLIAKAAVNQIAELRIQKHLYDCRVILDATEPIHYQKLALTHPDRLVIDVEKAYLVRSFRPSLLLGTPIKDIRSGIHKNKRLRLVFDLKHKVLSHAYTLKPSKAHPYYRLVLELNWKKVKPIYYETAFNAAKQEKPKPIKLPNKFSRSRRIIVVIDPGHGGKDPGAIGSKGTREKNVVLAIARYLQRDINHQSGFKAYLTRKSNYYLTLRQRLAITRRYKADMFIAIHADAIKGRHATGASVYALSQRGATSEAARWLAKKENESELMGGVELADKTNLLKSVLLNLSQTATIRSSLRIAQHILHSLDEVGRLHYRRVEQAAFVVLKSPDIPSLLVETGFISNPLEEKKLNNPRYQQRLSTAIMQGIRSYFTHSPPRGTWLFNRKFSHKKK